MAKGWVWNTGRYGYSSRLDYSNGIVFNINKFNKKGRDNMHVVAESFKLFIQRERWDEAFDVIDNAVVINLISVEKRDSLAKEYIPFLSDC